VNGEYLQRALSLTTEVINRFKKLLPKEILED